MEMFGVDAFSPAQIAEKVRSVGVSKARLPLTAMIMLGVAAGGFIGLGALFFTVVASDPTLPFAVTRVLGGVVFSLGLILVIIAGGELFTGNNFLVMAWADGKISTWEIIRNWAVVYFANALGATGMVLIVYLSGHGDFNHGAVAAQYVTIAAAKIDLSFWQAFLKGVLCNLLVCLAVWISTAGHSVADKILAIVFPITAFVAAGFEHCVANMYFIPLGILFSGGDAALPWSGLVRNLVPVTLGNITGGSLMVAAFYYVIYVRSLKASGPPSGPSDSGSPRS